MKSTYYGKTKVFDQCLIIVFLQYGLFYYQHNELMLQETIQKHRNQIEKKINQLENKFKQKIFEHPTTRPSINKKQDLYEDQKNELNLKKNNNSRTLQLRKNIISKQPLSEISQTQNRLNMKQIQKIGQEKKKSLQNISKTQKVISKQESSHFKDLYDMMKSIIDGQKNIQKQIAILKDNYLKDSSFKKDGNIFDRSLQSNSYSHGVTVKPQPENKSPIQKIDYQINTGQKSLKKPQIDKKSIIINDFDFKDENQLNTRQRINSLKKQQKSKLGVVKKNKNIWFDQMFKKLKKNKDNKQKVYANEEIKSSIWKQVEERIIASDKQYEDTIHRNNKHQHQHLLNTFELQKKIKDDLISKVYSQCNNLIYK